MSKLTTNTYKHYFIKFKHYEVSEYIGNPLTLHITINIKTIIYVSLFIWPSALSIFRNCQKMFSMKAIYPTIYPYVDCHPNGLPLREPAHQAIGAHHVYTENCPIFLRYQCSIFSLQRYGSFVVKCLYIEINKET